MDTALRFLIDTAEGMEDAPLWKYLNDAFLVALKGPDALLAANNILRRDDGELVVMADPSLVTVDVVPIDSDDPNLHHLDDEAFIFDSTDNILKTVDEYNREHGGA